MKYGIFGTFSMNLKHEHLSAYDLQKGGFFTGVLEVDEKGNVTGELEDSYGKSKISGFLDEKEISFEKNYLKPDGETGNTFQYNLFRRSSMESWSGVWRFTGENPENEKHEGVAICSLFLGD